MLQIELAEGWRCCWRSPSFLGSPTRKSINAAPQRSLAEFAPSRSSGSPGLCSTLSNRCGSWHLAAAFSPSRRGYTQAGSGLRAATRLPRGIHDETTVSTQAELRRTCSDLGHAETFLATRP
jgi:hypothetical protein